MKIAVLGTGMVGRAIAGKLANQGHQVTMGTRDPNATKSRSEPDQMGNPPFPVWGKENPEVKLAKFNEAVLGADMVVNATNGAGSLDALHAAGNLDGKVILDVSNPLDFSKGMPPQLFVSNSESLAERIQNTFPAAKVVKSLNTTNAYLMVDPKQLANGEHTVFVSGNDAAAKGKVSELLRGFGWTDVIDLGDITTARGPEMWLPLWLRIWGSTQSPMFNLKIVRAAK
jgi:8-hydroxy-5-deazaflavin:NADPH oxidoreductase